MAFPIAIPIAAAAAALRAAVAFAVTVITGAAINEKVKEVNKDREQSSSNSPSCTQSCTLNKNSDSINKDVEVPEKIRERGEINEDQAKHKPGKAMDEANEERKDTGYKQSEWENPEEADELTHEAFEKGKVVKTHDNGSPKEIQYKSDKVIGKNGEKGISVRVRKKGSYHGFPDGRIN